MNRGAKRIIYGERHNATRGVAPAQVAGSAVPLQSRSKCQSFLDNVLLSSGAFEHGMIEAADRTE